MEWKTIDSAPKDGTVVDLWIKAKDCEFRAVNMRYDTDRYLNETGWCCNGTDRILHFAYCAVDMIATHWMPLPESPK